MKPWPVAGLLAGMMLVTYGTRYTMIGLLGRLTLPAWARRWLEFIPVAAFTALIVPATLSPDGSLNLSFANPYAWATLVCALVAWRTKHTLITILAGLGAFWLLRWLGG